MVSSDKDAVIYVWDSGIHGNAAVASKGQLECCCSMQHSSDTHATIQEVSD